MTWQLYLASCAAANLKPGMPPVPSPGDPESVEWESALLQADYVLTNDNRDVENVGANGRGFTLRAKKPIPPEAGKVYFEIEIVAEGGTGSSLMRIGFLNEYTANWYNQHLGYSNTRTALNSIKHGCAVYINDGTLLRPGSMGYYVQGLSSSTGVTFTTGDVIGVIVDSGEGRVQFFKNNVYIGTMGLSLIHI